ncbi:MAG: ABC transporter permease [Acidobacteriota bacterium]
MKQGSAQRLSRAVLRLAPRHLQRSHGTEMEWMLAESLQTEPGRLGSLRVFCAALRDALSCRLAEGLEFRRRIPKRPLRGMIMNNLIQDIRYGSRTLLKSPGFTLVALLTLALGIGANTALFSLVNGVLLRPLPFEEPQDLVQIWESVPEMNFDRIPFSPPDYRDLVEMQQSFSAVAAYTSRQVELSQRGQPERALVTRVSASLFPLLGAETALGRSFSESEDQPGNPVAVLSDKLWQQRYGADPDILGKTVSMDRQPYTVIGVMTEGFEFPLAGPHPLLQPADLWIPLAFTPMELGRRGYLYNHLVVARLKPGVTLEQARAAAQLVGQQIQEQYPAHLNDFLRGGKLQMLVAPFHTEVVGPVRAPLFILLGAVGLVLLIGCANIANLLLSRANARRREIAIRNAMGAGRLRIFIQLFSESLMLALCGGLLGLAVAAVVIPLLLSLSPADLPRSSEIGIDGWVLAFT